MGEDEEQEEVMEAEEGGGNGKVSGANLTRTFLHRSSSWLKIRSCLKQKQERKMSKFIPSSLLSPPFLPAPLPLPLPLPLLQLLSLLALLRFSSTSPPPSNFLSNHLKPRL